MEVEKVLEVSGNLLNLLKEITKTAEIEHIDSAISKLRSLKEED